MIDIAALIIGAVSASASLFKEFDRRSTTKLNHSMVVTLQRLDLEKIIGLVGKIQLAGMMRGAMTAEIAEEVLSDGDLQGLCSELLLATIIEDREAERAALRKSIATHVRVYLDGRVAADDAEHFGKCLADGLQAGCVAVVDQARDASPDSVAAVQQLSLLKRVAAILDNVEKQTAAIARTVDSDRRAARDAFVSEYRKLCAAAHGFIQPPDFEKNQKVPIEALYVVPRVFDSASRHYKNANSISYDEFESSVDRTVLLGDPGGGKSTLSSYLATRLARSKDEPVPFLVTLREFAKEPDNLSVLQFIEKQLPAKYQIQSVDGVVEDLLLNRQALVIFDGLDELIDTTKRRAITSAVELFGTRYPLAKILVTSRRVGYDQARLDPDLFRVHEIAEFDDENVAEYVRKWFGSQKTYTPEQAEQASSGFISQSEAVGDLRANPLMLSLMCIIFHGEKFIPRNRPAIYEKCANLLFEKWDGHRDIVVPLKARDYVDAAMKHIAYIFLKTGAGDTGISYTDLVSEMTAYLYPHAMERREAAFDAATEFVDFCRGRAWVFSDAGTTAEGEALYTFTHRTFMEYFAAVHLIRTSDSPEELAKKLLPRVAKEEWDVVAQLAVQQADKSAERGAERALALMLDDRRRRSVENRGHVLQFIARCSRFAVVSPALMRRISAACLEYYLSGDGRLAFAPSGSMRPSLALCLSSSDEHAITAVDATRLILDDELSGPDTYRRFLSAYLVLYWSLRRARWLADGSDSSLAIWEDMFTDLGVKHVKLFESLAEADPMVWSTLATAGLCEPGVAVANMRRTGLGFGEIYFATVTVRDHYFVGLPLAISVSEMATIEPNTSDQYMAGYDRANAIAASFLTDFWSGEPRQPPGSGGEPWYPGALTLDLSARASVPLREASVIAALASLERLQADGHDMERFSRSVLSPNGRKGGAGRKDLLDMEVIGSFQLTPQMMTFVTAWGNGKVDVFESNANARGSKADPD